MRVKFDRILNLLREEDITVVGGIIYGGPVGGGNPNEILYIDGFGNLGSDANFLWDSANLNFNAGDLSNTGNGTSRNFSDGSARIFDTIGTALLQNSVIFTGAGLNNMTLRGHFTGISGTTYTVTITELNTLMMFITNIVGPGFTVGDVITSTPDGVTGEVTDIDLMGGTLSFKNLTGSLEAETSIDNGAGTTADLNGSAGDFADTMFWTDNVGNSGTAQTSWAFISNGLFLHFQPETGHTIGDSWAWSYTTQPAPWLDIRGGIDGIIRLWPASQQTADPSNQGLFIQSAESTFGYQYPVNGLYLNYSNNNNHILASYDSATHNAVASVGPGSANLNYGANGGGYSFIAAEDGRVHFGAQSGFGSDISMDDYSGIYEMYQQNVGTMFTDIMNDVYSFGNNGYVSYLPNVPHTFVAGTGGEIGFGAIIDPIIPVRRYGFGDLDLHANGSVLMIDDTNKILSYNDNASIANGFDYININAATEDTRFRQTDGTTYDAQAIISKIGTGIAWQDFSNGELYDLTFDSVNKWDAYYSNSIGSAMNINMGATHDRILINNANNVTGYQSFLMLSADPNYFSLLYSEDTNTPGDVGIIVAGPTRAAILAAGYAIELDKTTGIRIWGVPHYADNTAATTAGLATGNIYCTNQGGSTFLKIVP